MNKTPFCRFFILIFYSHLIETLFSGDTGGSIGSKEMLKGLQNYGTENQRLAIRFFLWRRTRTARLIL